MAKLLAPARSVVGRAKIFRPGEMEDDVVELSCGHFVFEVELRPAARAKELRSAGVLAKRRRCKRCLKLQEQVLEEASVEVVRLLGLAKEVRHG